MPRSGDKTWLPRHLPIMLALREDILGGVYSTGSRLPGEAELAARHQVSRNTLRQALLLLEEEGLIARAQGRGTYVTYEKKEEAAPDGHFNPMIQFAKRKITSRETSYNFTPPSEIAMERLGVNASEILIASNTVYYAEELPIGYSFVQVPVKYVSDLKIDLSNDYEVATFTDQTIYSITTSMRMWVYLVHSKGNLTDYLKIPEGVPLLLLEEVLCDRQQRPIARCRLYFRYEEYDICFHSSHMGDLMLSGQAAAPGSITRTVQNQAEIVVTSRSTPPPQGPPRKVQQKGDPRQDGGKG